MLNQPKSSAVLFAKDLPRVAKFDETLLDMVVIVADRDYIVLESPECQLVVHNMPKNVADAIALFIWAITATK
jgi:hypothetical protein